MEVHLTGAFPHSEVLVELNRAVARGRIPPVELQTGLSREVSELVALQTEAGVDVLVDGQLNWRDLFRPFSDLFSGIRPGALVRWFDNNTFYRKPVIIEKVGYRGGLDTYFRRDLLPEGKRCKAVLPGPYTFAALSENVAYRSFEDLIDDLAHALHDAVVDLNRAGYQCFQFNEPCICAGLPSENQLAAIRQAYTVLVKGLNAQSALHTYFGDISNVVDSALDLPTDSIGIDFYATSVESLKDHNFTKKIDCGCIDARNSLLETAAGLKKLLVTVQDELSPKSVSVAPNCDLDFLPYSVATKKLRLLTTAAQMVV